MVGLRDTASVSMPSLRCLRRVTRDELDELASEWDERVSADGDVDRFCSGSAWQLAFHDAFEPERPLWLARSDDGLVVLAESRRPRAPGLLEPLENMWGFASPLIGAGAGTLLGRSLARDPRPVLLLGLPIDRRRLRPLVDALGDTFSGRVLSPTERFVASLEGGLEGWLARRSRTFRRSLRGATRRSEAAEVSFRRLRPTSADEVDRLYASLLEVEARSWKGRAGRGTDQEPMRSFYAGMLPRLGAAGALRGVVAERAGHLVGYLYGGLVGRHFRGLQFSYDEELRAVGLGNVLQLEMLRWLCEEGATHYDLGGQSSYKARWGEAGPESLSIFLRPRA